MTADISRHSLRPEQQYTQVVHQQGRPPLDADLNEGYDLAGLMLRETVAEAICTKGSPDEGFKITPPVTPSAQAGLDFNIAQGNYFLAGSRINSPGVSYRSQPDWLTFLLDDPGPDLPASGQERLDLIYVEAREQVVGATEDAELLEPGLGGPDSAARRRLMWRVQVMENVSGECADAMDQLVAQRYPGGQLDADRCTIESNAILTIGFTKLDPLEELCRPSAQAGFLGARNETFRLQVSAPGRFVWSRDNAAPLYRVQVANDENGQPRKLVFLNSPRDEFGWPQAGMTVELMRWGALLDNGEKAAEPLGLFMSVSNGYDTSDDSILVSSDVPAPWTQWFSTPEGQAAINPRDPAEEGAYFFLRVWTGGGQAGAVDHAMNPGNPVVLGETGLTATFSGIGIPGDYWIISARPNTPTSVLPWALLDGAPPRGPRRLLAPLALLNWKGPAPGEPRDCRNRFRPLCRIGGCCVITVGDGLNSYGDFTSIQQAVNHLPDDGGMICIHAGDYQEHVTIFNKQNITITGCGRNTRWQGETDNTKALLDIRDSSGIIVRSLAMTGTASESIMAHKVPIPTQKSPLPLEDLLLEDLEITASDVGAIAGLDGKGIVIRRCHISLEKLSAGLNDSDVIGRAAAIFLAGEDLTVENCRIEAAEIKDSLRLPVGGIHIGGGSEQVIIRDNVIQGGNGHGISLGSIQYVPPQGPEVNSDSIKPKREFTSNPKKRS